MRVRRFMQTNVITIPSDTLITDAQQIMQQNNIRRLPVVDQGKLVGIITRTNLRDVAPSEATSLSVWELNYLLSKIRVKDVMERQVITISLDATVEEAAALTAEHHIGALPVMDGGRLVGIITETDLFDLFVDVLGVRKAGSRIQIVEPYKDKPFGLISEIIARHQAKILSVFTFTDPKTQCQDMVIHLAADDPASVASDIEESGFRVVDFQADVLHS